MQQQRTLHPLERIVAMCALVLVLFLSIGFAQADEVRKIALRSSSVLVQDAGTGEIVINKNAEAVVPIASITKLMTAMVILDRGLDLEENIVLNREDAVGMKGSRSRLRTGLGLTRGDLLLLALMSSENRAAAALGRSYPGGMEAFVDAMNAKAVVLDMPESRFVEPTGLSPANVSTASDLAKLVRAAHDYPLIREFSTRDRPLELAEFRDDVVAGLSAPQKSLSPKYFYDAAGSRLFARICRLPEYYLTRAELALTRRHIAAIARFAGRGCQLIEYGSGESLKTRLLIRALRPAAYVPIDISPDALQGAARRLAHEFPWLEIVPLLGDFSRPL